MLSAAPADFWPARVLSETENSGISKMNSRSNKLYTSRRRGFLLLLFLVITLVAASLFTRNMATLQPRTPSETVREFYKTMREKRFREAFMLTIYRSAVEGLTANELEELRPGFEEKAAQIPPTIEITSEQINGNTAIVFVRIPMTTSTPQVTSEPVNLINSGGAWIIGNEADQAEVKKGGRRFFLDALITEHEGDVEDLFKRLVLFEGIYSQQHNGMYGDLAALIAGGLLSADVIDPRLSGYNFHITVAKDGKGYVATAEPLRHGRTGKLSFWMDQTGLIKKVDNGGKPLKP